MDENQKAIPAQRENFVVAGFRELGRKFGRAKLRKAMRLQDAQRKTALAALGQRAWEEAVDLAAFPEHRERLAAMNARAGDLAQASTKLESEKAALEAQRRTEVANFTTRRGAVNEKKNPIDVSLRAGRSAKSACEKTLEQGGSRLAAIGALLPKLDGEIAALIAPEQQQRLAAAKEERSRLASEQSALRQKVEAARAQLPGLTAEESRLAAESQKYAAEIAAVNAEEKAVLGRLDADLSRLRSELAGTSRQQQAVQKDRAQAYEELGERLYEAKIDAAALVEPVARIAALDRERTETQAAHQDSLGKSGALPRGTMPLFWTVTIGVPLAAAALGFAAQRYLAARDAASAVTAARGTSEFEVQRGRVVRHFIDAGRWSDKKLRDQAVSILKEDIEVMGGTADPAHLPVLARVLRSGEAELRAAAAQAMAMIGPTPAETAELARLRGDSTPEVARAAKRALAASSDPAANALASSP